MLFYEAFLIDIRIFTYWLIICIDCCTVEGDNMNKKVFNLFLLFIISLFLISATYAADDSQVNQTSYEITSDLSNDDIQALFDNANEGDIFEFTSDLYSDISLIVDKKLNIFSDKNSVVEASSQASEKAKSMGISKTFGFYFTSNAHGSVLSGITIKAGSCDNAIIIAGANNVTIDKNIIEGAVNGVLIDGADGITLSNNKITKATENGVQLKDVKNIEISNNEIYRNGRSGIETYGIHDSMILNNTIHHNSFNGISMYDTSSGNLIKFNIIHNNTNGIYIDCKTDNDVILANTLSHNRRDPWCELGPDESGNGLLFGDQFEWDEDTKLLVMNNALIHNEQFQAKNNPANEKFELDQNWFDSNDPEHTYVCPMLLAKILKLNTITIKNGIGLQVQEDNGKPVTEMGTFDVPVEVNGNRYTATVKNGQAIIQSEDLEPNTEYDVDITLGDNQKQVIKKKATSGPEKYIKESDSNNQEGGDDSGNSNSNNQDSGKESNNENSGASDNSGNGTGTGTGNGNSTTTDSRLANSGTTNKYGSNSSDIYSQDSSETGENALSNGDEDAESSTSDGSSGDSSKSYEVIPEKQISKSVVDTSGAVILSIVALLGCLVYGYRKKDDEE